MSGYNDDTLDEFPPFGSSRPSIYHEPQRRDTTNPFQDRGEVQRHLNQAPQMSPRSSAT